MQVCASPPQLPSFPPGIPTAALTPCLRPAALPLPCQGHFPEPDKDPVIQIASLVTEFGQKAPTVRNIMTLKSCAPITGAGARRGRGGLVGPEGDGSQGAAGARGGCEWRVYPLRQLAASL